MLIAPVLLLVAGSASVFVRTQFTAIAGRFEIVSMLGPLVVHALRLMPLLLIWALFTLIYMAMPNTRVAFSAAAAGAAVGGVLYQLVQWFYIELQVGVASRNAIYGSFAALPLFLVWVHLSWTIVLFGAELCYGVQHRGAGGPEPAAGELKLIGLRIAHAVVRRFAEGRPPADAGRLAQELGIPLHRVQPLAAALVSAGLFSVTPGPRSEEPAFQPAVDIRRITLQRVADALDDPGGAGAEPSLPAAPNDALAAALHAWRRAAAESPSNRLLMDID
jgi:membrane protein